VGEARGLGLIGALELAEDPAARKPFDPARGVGAQFVRSAQAHGVITRVLGGDVIAFSPPLIISEAEIDVLVEDRARAGRHAGLAAPAEPPAARVGPAWR
jgi:4-aminobutyrate--pyruvate transaminase